LKAKEELEQLGKEASTQPCVEAWETTNLYHLALAIVRSALLREETRGSHWREDFPESLDAWAKHIVQRMDSQGNWSSSSEEVSKS
jgi:L-aspartate oxidase